MNKTDGISFWTPIESNDPVQKFSKDWVRFQADNLFHFGREVYRLDIKTNELTLDKNAQAPSTLDKVIRIALIALVIFPLVAIVIKAYDRLTHTYTLIKSPPLPGETPPTTPRGENTPPPPGGNNGLSEEQKQRALENAKLQALEQARKSAEDRRLKEAEIEAQMKAAEQEQKTREAAEAQLKAEQEQQAREAAEAKLKAEQEQQAREAAEAKLKAEQEQKAREAAEAKLKAEQEQKAQEAILKPLKFKKCYEIAERFLPEMLKMLRDEKGEWNNTFEKDKISRTFWNKPENKAKDPDMLRNRAYAAKNAAERQALLTQADESDKMLKNHLDNEVQKTLFPMQMPDDKKVKILKKEDVFVDCTEDFSNRECFYAAPSTSVEKIKKEGFEVEYAVKRSSVDGLGTSLSLKKDNAEWLVNNNLNKNGSILSANVQVKGKLANRVSWVSDFVSNYISDMASLYIRENKSILHEELVKAGVCEKSTPVFNEYSSALSIHLTNLLKREFYINAGYRGFVNTMSVTLYYPEDIVKVS